MADRQKFLRDAGDAYTELEEAVAGLDETQAQRVWLGTWGVREILIHVAGWHREMTPALQRVARGEAPYPAGAYDDADAWNARFVDARKGVKLVDVLAELGVTHREFMTTASALPDELLAPGGAARDPFEGTAAQHYREHAEQIRRWRQTARS